MGFRFRKSVRIAPGVRMNFGRGGFSSVNLGGVTFGKRGVYANYGLKGSGISYRQRLSGGTNSRPATKRTRTTTEMAIRLDVQPDGSVAYQDKSGRPLSPELIQIAKRQNRQGILAWLENQCAEYNSDIEKLINIHQSTPAPHGDIEVNPKPIQATPKSHGLTSRILKSHKEKIDKQNSDLATEYEKALSEWEKAEIELRNNPDTMADVLEAAFNSVVWPRETLISFDVLDKGKKVLLDVDFPEIENMPENIAKVGSRDLKLVISKRPKTQIQKDYLRHLHAIGFRLIGDVFAHLPSAETVVFSGFSQRIDKKTGNTRDEYLLSVKARREDWEKINFKNLEAVDPVLCLQSYEVKQSIGKNNHLQEIVPFEN